MKKKDPDNCPFCQAEERGHSEGWGMCPEGWQELERKHYQEHCDKCPT